MTLTQISKARHYLTLNISVTTHPTPCDLTQTDGQLAIFSWAIISINDAD